MNSIIIKANVPTTQVLHLHNSQSTSVGPKFGYTMCL